MNREIAGGTDTLQQSSSSSYLVYLFLVSAALIVFLPYLFPTGGGLLVRSGKKVEVVGKVKSNTYKRGSSSTYTSLASDAVIKKMSYTESKCEALETLVVDLRNVVEVEREKTFELENEVRVLQISESFLKERVVNLEERNLEYRKGLSTGYISGDLGVQNTLISEGKQENADVLVRELLRIAQMEKERTSALETEVRILQRSEIILLDRIQKLEDKFASYMTTCGQSCDNKNEQNDYMMH